MKVKEGKAVWEEVPCGMCDSTGRREEGILCPNWNKSTGNRPCPVCKGKGRSNHKVVGTKVVECVWCEGKGKKVEDRYSFDQNWAKENLYISLSSAPPTTQTFAEAYIGVGLASITDYGRYKALSPGDFVSKAREDLTTVQYCKYVKEDGTVAKELVMCTNSQGYSIHPVFEVA